MRHQKTRHKLSRDAAHRKALLANLCKEVIQHERIKTSEAKAKAVKPEVEQLITLAKRGDLHARRQALSDARAGQVHGPQAVRGGRAALRGAARRLHAHPQARSASQRRDRDGLPRARLSRAAATSVVTARHRVRRHGFAGWARQPGQRTVQGELERGARGRAARAGRADRRRAHRPRRARAGAGRLVRGRAGAAAVAQRAARRRRRGARQRARPPTASTRAATRARARTATACCTRRVRSAFERGRALSGRTASTATRCTRAPRLLRGTHDFTAFTPTETDHVRFERDVFARRVGRARRPPRVLHRGRHVHAPHEPRAGRHDARGRGRPALARLIRARCWRAARAPRRARPRRRTGCTWPRCGTDGGEPRTVVTSTDDVRIGDHSRGRDRGASAVAAWAGDAQAAARGRIDETPDPAPPRPWRACSASTAACIASGTAPRASRRTISPPSSRAATRRG